MDMYTTLGIRTAAAPFPKFTPPYFWGQPSNLPAAALRWIYFIAKNEKPTKRHGK